MNVNIFSDPNSSTFRHCVNLSKKLIDLGYKPVILIASTGKYIILEETIPIQSIKVYINNRCKLESLSILACIEEMFDIPPKYIFSDLNFGVSIAIDC